jgi:hypothetical protein
VALWWADGVVPDRDPRLQFCLGTFPDLREAAQIVNAAGEEDETGVRGLMLVNGAPTRCVMVSDMLVS